MVNHTPKRRPMDSFARARKIKMEIIVELKIFDGINWLAEYTYVVDGHRWKDQKRVSAIFKKGEISYQSKGMDRRYPPLLLR